MFMGSVKKAGGHSAERLKYKRRYRDRLGYFLDVTGWGKFCLWKARLNKKYYFINGFYTIYMYLRNIFLYFLIILVYLIIYYLIYNKKLYTSNKYKVWRYKILKDFYDKEKPNLDCDSERSFKRMLDVSGDVKLSKKWR